MRTLSLALCCLFVGQGAWGNGSVTWYSPSENSRGSMPIGNGDIGANVWLEPDGDLVLLLSKTDAWSENARLLKLGRLRIATDPPLHESGAAFTQQLHCDTGMIEIQSVATGGRQSSILLWIDANRPVLHVEVESTPPCQVAVHLELWRTERREMTNAQELHSAYGVARHDGHPVFVEADTVLDQSSNRIVFFHRNQRSVWAENLRLQALGELADPANDPLMHRTFGAMVRGEGLVNDGRDRLVSKAPSTRHVVSVYPLTTRTDTAGQWIDQVEKGMAEIDRVPLENARAAHQAWWGDFWDRSWLHVSRDGAEQDRGSESDAAVVSRGYVLQRWVNACAGRGGSPIKFNGTLFTVDTEGLGGKEGGFDPDYRRWGGCYWWQNTRLPYWSMLAAGDYDLMPPLFKMYMDALPLRQHAARTYYQHDGAFYPETMCWWGTYSGDNYGWDRDGKPPGLTDNLYIRRYWQSGIELLAMMLDYYDHTRDPGFRDLTLLPYAHATVAFFDQHWPRNPAGTIHFHPAQSLETWWDSTNPLPEIASLRWLLPRLMDITNDERQRKAWAKTLHDLPPIPIGGEAGKRFLMPAERFAAKHNQENPELYAIWPYRIYGVGRPDLDVALETWSRRQHKNSGGWQQNAIQAACLGRTDEARTFVVDNFSRHAGGYRFPAMWGPNFDWIPDQDHGSVAMIALQAMALQTDGRKMFLLPAWPTEWDVHFKLNAPGHTTVECEYRDGVVVKLNVDPPERRTDVVMP